MYVHVYVCVCMYVCMFEQQGVREHFCCVHIYSHVMLVMPAHLSLHTVCIRMFHHVENLYACKLVFVNIYANLCTHMMYCVTVFFAVYACVHEYVCTYVYTHRCIHIQKYTCM
jgi:hypothetical protein